MKKVSWKPVTRLGWWAAWLGAAYIVMWIINTVAFMPTSSSVAPWRQVILPFYGIFMMLCGLVSGIIGLIAVIRKHERAVLVWLTLLPGAFVLFFLLGEFLVPH